MEKLRLGEARQGAHDHPAPGYQNQCVNLVPPEVELSQCVLKTLFWVVLRLQGHFGCGGELRGYGYVVVFYSHFS